MKDKILTNLNDPRQLEELCRSNKANFKKNFNALYPEIKDSTPASFWYARLNFEIADSNPVTGKDMPFIIMACIIAGFIAKIPAMLNIDKDLFYARNAGFIVFPLLTVYFAWKNKLSAGKIVFITTASIAGLIFINCLPNAKNSDTLVLSCIHLLLFLWSVLGFAFVGGQQNFRKRLGFLRYNGDLVVMTTLILIAGGIMTAVTVGLFSLIGLNIENYYFDYVGIFGLASAPIVATYLTQTNPQLVGKVSPVIARIFSPLVLVMLIVYLVAIIYSSKNPYNDREFLLIFNALLVGVMAIIFFSVAEATNSSRSRVEIWLLLLLSVVTIIVNGVALSAIVFRISTWGITPNRAAVLGGNVLILINLVWVTTQIFKVLTRKAELSIIGKTTSDYLPVYCIWTFVVTFIFPLLFGFK